MWYQRLLSWLRSIFAPARTPASYTQTPPSSARTPTLPLTTPLHDPQLLDNLAPPTAIEFPPRREPPTTVPLARIVHPSQPLAGSPPAGDSLGALQMRWTARDNTPPSQPIQPPPPIQPASPSQPLNTDLTSFNRVEPEPVDFGEEDVNDLEEDIAPGSILYRRLMILRRLVRQGVYNEGFSPDATPEQYQRYADPDSFDTPFYGE